MSQSSPGAEGRRAISPLARRVLRGGIWSVGGRMAGLGFAFLVNAALARLLSPDDFGVFLLVVSIIGFGSILARFGLDRTLIRFIAESLSQGDVERARSALRRGYRLAAIASVVTLLAFIPSLALANSRWLTYELPGGLIASIAAGLVLLAFLQLAADSLRGFQELKFASLFDARSNGPLLNIAFLALFLSVAAVQPLSVSLASYLYVAAVGCILIVAVIFLRRTARRAFSACVAEQGSQSRTPVAYAYLLAVCAPMAMVQALNFSSVNAGVWIAGASVTAGQLALFAAARRLIQIVAVPLYMSNLTMISFIPELHAQGRTTELQQLLRSTATASTALSLVVLGVVWVLPREVLSLAFGDHYRAAANVLVVLSIGQFVACWTGGCANCLAMTGHQNTLVIVSAVTTLTLFLAGTLAVQNYGIIGLAWISSAVMAAKNLIQWLIARKLVGVWTHAAFPRSLRGVAP